MKKIILAGALAAFVVAIVSRIPAMASNVSSKNAGPRGATGATGAPGPTNTTSILLGANAASNTTLPTAGTITGGTTISGGTADQAGGDVTISAGPGKGTGDSHLILRVPKSGSTGTALNAQVVGLDMCSTADTQGLNGALYANFGAQIRAQNSIFVAGTALYLNVPLTFLASTNNNNAVFPDNLANGWWIGEGSNHYLDLVSTDGAEAAVFSKPFWGTLSSVNAAGTGQSDGTAIAAGAVWVTVPNANGTLAVTLPTGSVATCVKIMAQSATITNTLKVYGNNSDNDTINGGIADAVYVQLAGTSLTYCTANGVAWFTY